MKCPHCDNDIPGVPCGECGGLSPEGALFCMACGSSLSPDGDAETPAAEVPQDDGDFDFENRVLCPDGTCTGIMVDGRCTECGKVKADGE